MSRHAAAALLGFAVWQIWLAMALTGLPGSNILPWAALVLLLLGALPFARRLEGRWHRLAADSFPSPALVQRYRRDRALLWLLVLAAPPLWLAIVLGVAGLVQIF